MKDNRVRCVICRKKQESDKVYHIRIHPRAATNRVCRHCLEIEALWYQVSNESYNKMQGIARLLPFDFDYVDFDRYSDPAEHFPTLRKPK